MISKKDLPESFYGLAFYDEGGMHAAEGAGYTEDQLLDFANQQLEKQRQVWEQRVKEAFREGYYSQSTYNDKEVSDVDAEWESKKKSLLR